MTSVTDILSTLQQHRFRFNSELDLQNGIALVLTKSGVYFDREYKLSARDKIDFLCHDVGIEVKVDGSANTLARQIMRYLRSSELNAIIVVTSRSSHVLPESLDGKPIHVVYVGGL